MRKEAKIHFETLKTDGFPDPEEIFEGLHLRGRAMDAYIRGKDKLDPVVTKKIESHLDICEKCRKVREEELKKREQEKQPEPQELTF